MLVTANIFQPLISVFETVLKFFHNSGGISWGWSIVLLTIGVRAILLPLTFRQIKSMVRMQSLGPQIKAIQQKYKQDKARQQEEVMKFYRENNVNPLASCLPLVAQFPVFIALYYMLRKSLRADICPGVQRVFQHAYAAQNHVSFASAGDQTTACGAHGGSSFLFVHDLTAKATGIELAVLIVLYVGTQLGSTLLMSGATMDPTQRKVMMFLPLVFVLFVIRFPAGLLVYWITTNLWTVAQQGTVRRLVGPTVAVSAPDVGSGVSIGGVSGSGSGSGGVLAGAPSGGGFGGRLRERLAAAQSDAEATRRGKSAAPAAPDAAGADTSSGTASANRSTKNGGRARAPSSRRSDGSGSGNGTSGSVSGTANGNGSSAAGGGTPPPRPPRKKKKRSGRRR